jgi:carboxyl-terminal processing protease
MKRWVLAVALLWLPLLIAFSSLHLLLILGLPLSVAAVLAIVSLFPVSIGGYTAPKQNTFIFTIATAAILLPLLVAGGVLFLGQKPLVAWWLVQPSLYLTLAVFPILLLVLAASRMLKQLARENLVLRMMLRGTLALVVLGVCFFTFHLQQIGLLPIARGSYVGAYERLWQNLDRYYSHWETSPIQPEALKARYEPQVAAAAEACATVRQSCLLYQSALSDMLAELEDGHTRLSPRRPLAVPPLIVEPLEGKAVITYVEPDSEAENLGVVPGMVILAVDGRPVAEALRAVPAWATAYTASHTRLRYTYRYLLAGNADEQVAVTLEAADGIRKLVTLQRTGRDRRFLDSVEGSYLESGVAYIAVRSAFGQVTVARFDLLLHEMVDAAALILDLRGNGGGASLVGDQIVGRLLEEAVVHGTECFRAPHPMHGWTAGCREQVVTPRGEAWTKPLAVLLDGEVASTGEWMAATLCDSGRARCFGRRTAGDSGNPVFFFVPGGTVQFSTGNYRRADGTLLNGIGIAPHETISWRVEDVRQGYDPDLKAALDWLDGELAAD